jgi:hypothetical protein
MNEKPKSKAIKSYNLPVCLFLMEIQQQCTMAEYSFGKLALASKGWLSSASPEEFQNAAFPMEIFSYCISFLSSAGTISKILFSTQKKTEIQERCKALRTLLEIQNLPAIENLSVRNSFEHLDERLDKCFKNFKKGKIVPFLTTEKAPEPDEFVLKRFDPKNLAISYSNKQIKLVPCMHEIEELSPKVEIAYKKLTGPKINIWGR